MKKKTIKKKQHIIWVWHKIADAKSYIIFKYSWKKRDGSWAASNTFQVPFMSMLNADDLDYSSCANNVFQLTRNYKVKFDVSASCRKYIENQVRVLMEVETWSCEILVFIVCIEISWLKIVQKNLPETVE